MSITNTQLLDRIQDIERWIVVLQTGLNNSVTNRELKNLTALISSQVTSLQDMVGNLDTVGALNLPCYTTTERNALISVSSGAVIYNTTLGKIQVFTSSSWETVTSS